MSLYSIFEFKGISRLFKDGTLTRFESGSDLGCGPSQSDSILLVSKETQDYYPSYKITILI